MAQNTRRPCLDQSLQESRASGMLGKRPYFSMFDWGPISELHHYHGKKCRRMSNEQVRVLEKSFFEVGAGKFEEEKKKKLAQELGLQPHQVVVWFQNRQARWKSQQLHLRNDHLKQASDAVMADNHKLRAQVAELKAELEAYKNNGKDIVLRSVKSESETEVEANEWNQTGIKMSRTLGKYNLSKKCSKMGPDACGGGIDIDINMDMDGDNFSSVQDVSSMNLMKCHGDEEESYCSFLTDPDLYYSDSYSCCSLWD